MRLYRGDIGKVYDRQVFPLGAVSYADGKGYKFCQVDGALTIKKWNAVKIDTSNVVTLSDGTVVDGVSPIDVVVAASETKYIWVQVKGTGYVSVDDAESGSIADKLIDCTAEDGRASAYAFSAASPGAPTDAELNALLLVARTCKVLGQGATTFTDKELMGDVDETATYTHATTTVSGTGTSFTDWFEVGDKVVLSGTELTITAITDDTTMTVSGGTADISASRVYRERRVAPVEIND